MFSGELLRLARHGQDDEGVVRLVLGEVVERLLDGGVHQPAVVQRYVQDVKDPEVGGVLEAGDAVELDVDVQTVLQGWEDVEGVVPDLLQVGLRVAVADASLDDGSSWK